MSGNPIGLQPGSAYCGRRLAGLAVGPKAPSSRAGLRKAKKQTRLAVVESFLEKVDRQVGNRIDAQLAALRPPATPASDQIQVDTKRSQLGAMAAGSVLTALASGAAVAWSVHYPGSSPVKALALVWAILAVAYIAYAWRLRRR